MSDGRGETSALAARTHEATVLALFDRLPELIVLIEADGRIRLANQRLLDTMGYTLDEVIGSNIFDYVHPDDLAYMAWSWENRQANPGETGILIQARGRNADDTWRAVEILGLSLFDEDAVGGMVMSMRDLSRNSALADSPARLRSMVDRTTDVVLLLDAQGHIDYANRRLTSRYGLDQDRVVGRPFASLLHPEDASDAIAWFRELVTAGDRASARTRLRVVGPDGTRHDVEWHGTNQLGDPLIDGIILSGRDITELVAMEAQVREQTAQLVYTAEHDPLTSLYNRRAFLEIVTGRLVERRSAADPQNPGDAIVLFCDLDRFKIVNDTHGHEIGDQVLRAVGGRLRSCLRDDDVIARWGGDEFTILLGADASPAVVAGLIARLEARLEEPIVCGPIVADVGVTVGIGRAGVLDADGDALLRDADHAMYAKKPHRR